MSRLKEQLNPEALNALQNFIRKQTDIRNIKPEDFEVTKKALELLLSWLSEIYNVDSVFSAYEPDIDFDKMFINKPTL